MLNNYKQLTGRYLKANKKRTLLTIIGIVLSVALIATIGFFIVGMQQAEIDSIKNDYGSWHVSFSKPSSDVISKVTNNPKVSRSGLYQMDENIIVGEGVRVSPIIATDRALELLPCKIKEGRFPENKNEAAVENWVLPHINKDAKIGEKIKLDNREYTLVGILQDSVASQVQGSGIFLSKSNNIDSTKAVLLAEISPKTNLGNAVKELDSLTNEKIVKTDAQGKKVTVSSVVNNSPLIDIQGGGDGKKGISQLYTSVAVSYTHLTLPTKA